MWSVFESPYPVISESRMYLSMGRRFNWSSGLHCKINPSSTVLLLSSYRMYYPIVGSYSFFLPFFLTLYPFLLSLYRMCYPTLVSMYYYFCIQNFWSHCWSIYIIIFIQFFYPIVDLLGILFPSYWIITPFCWPVCFISFFIQNLLSCCWFLCTVIWLSS